MMFGNFQKICGVKILPGIQQIHRQISSEKKNYSEKDKKDWENFLKSDVDIEVKDKEFFSQNIAKQSIPKLDLHGSTL